PVAWLVSARSEAALRAQAERLHRYVAARESLGAHAVARSLASTRSRLDHRGIVLGSGREDLLSGLSALAAGRPSAAVVEGVAGARGNGRVAFIFPGQGTQWPGMGRDLWQTSNEFREEMQACRAALSPYVSWDLEHALHGDE